MQNFFKRDVIKFNIKLCSVILFMYCINSCNSSAQRYQNREPGIVKDSVSILMQSIARDINQHGPIAWLTHFDNQPGFFMASAGSLQFPDYDSASRFIKNTLVKKFSKIALQWSNIRIEPLTDSLASIGADYQEQLTQNSGDEIAVSGYFTGIASYRSGRWKLYTAHWSVL